MRRIIELQRIQREIGRIRTGEKVAASRGGQRPSKLDKFRLTSQHLDVLTQCAEAFGGTIREWKDAPGTAQQWELYTERDSLDIIVPPDITEPFSLVYELWNAGGCVRRCDGVNSELNVIEGVVGADCVCNPDNRECKLTMRLSVFLTGIDTLGVWRLESHGFYAAAENLGTVELLSVAAGRGMFVPAKLKLEQRQSKRIVKGKSETYNYAVPVIHIGLGISTLLTGEIGGAIPAAIEVGQARAIESGSLAVGGGLTPVPNDSAPTVAEAVQSVDEPAPKRPRKNAAEPVKSTGRGRPAGRGARPPTSSQDETGPGSTEEPGHVDPGAGSGADSGTLDDRRVALRARFGALPAAVAEEVKRDWTQLGYPSLRAARGWDVDKIEWAERLAEAAEKKTTELTIATRQRCAILTRELEWDDDERHEWVEAFTGQPGLSALDLDMLEKVEGELIRLTGGRDE